MSNNTIKIEFVTIFVLDILSSYERERVKDTLKEKKLEHNLI